MKPAVQQQHVDLNRGLFLVRYESADDAAQPPQVTVSAESDSRDIEVILAPDAGEPVLWSPGGCLLVRAERGGRLRIKVEAGAPNASVAAKVQVVALSQDPNGAARAPNGPAHAPGSAEDLDVSSLRVLGHVARIGDVLAGPGEWVGGPLAPSRIEGFAIEWPNIPGDVGLRYAVKVSGPQPASTPFVRAGDFAGTRGRALPLVGAALELTGHGARGHRLAVDAIFLGSPQRRVTGQRVVLSGPTGREPLVGLRVGIEASARTQPAKGEAANQGDAPKNAIADAKVNISAQSAPAHVVSTTDEPQKSADESAGTNTASKIARKGVQVFRSTRSKSAKLAPQ